MHLITEKYTTAKNKLILLDYDGTLISYKALPEKATPSEPLLYLLQKLSSKPNTKLALVSGRSSSSIDNLLPGQQFDIVAEHGAMLKHNNQWSYLVKEETKWKETVSKVMSIFTALCPGSFIEEKQFGLAWHYRNCIEQDGIYFSRQLISELKNPAAEFHLKVTDGKKVVEVNSIHINKGNAVQYFINTVSYDYILCIGDDRTDEDMFRVLFDNSNAYTIKVGEGDTLAKYKFRIVEDVIILLEQLST